MQAAQSVGWYVCSFFLPPSPTAFTSSLTVTTTPSLVSGLQQGTTLCPANPPRADFFCYGRCEKDERQPLCTEGFPYGP